MIDGGYYHRSIAANAESKAFAVGTSLELYQSRRGPMPFGREYRYRSQRSEEIVHSVLPEIRVGDAKLKFRGSCNRKKEKITVLRILMAIKKLILDISEQNVYR